MVSADGRGLRDAGVKGLYRAKPGSIFRMWASRLGPQLCLEGIVVNAERIRWVQRQYQLYPIRLGVLKSPSYRVG
jgi:hypothetical protein